MPMHARNFASLRHSPGTGNGNGPCKAGSQSCVLADDKTSSYWGSCAGSVGPAGADTCNPDNDNNCNGIKNEGCSCVNGTSIDCECGGCASDQMNREWCPSTGGVLGTEYCNDGCYEGDCRSDGTIGVPGFVSCRHDTPLTYCPVNAGCDAYETTCGTTSSPGTIRCDGPNDCPGQGWELQPQRGLSFRLLYRVRPLETVAPVPGG